MAEAKNSKMSLDEWLEYSGQVINDSISALGSCAIENAKPIVHESSSSSESAAKWLGAKIFSSGLPEFKKVS